MSFDGHAEYALELTIEVRTSTWPIDSTASRDMSSHASLYHHNMRRMRKFRRWSHATSLWTSLVFKRREAQYRNVVFADLPQEEPTYDAKRSGPTSLGTGHGDRRGMPVKEQNDVTSEFPCLRGSMIRSSRVGVPFRTSTSPLFVDRCNN